MNLNKNKRLLGLLVLALLAITLSGCSGQRLASTSWPGMVVDDGLAFIAFNQQIYSVNPADQRVEWQFENPLDAQSTFYAPPVVADGTLVVGGYDSVLYGIDRETLGIQWNFHLATDRFVASPVLYEGRVYAATAGNELFVLDLATLQGLGAVEKSDEARRSAEQDSVTWKFTAQHGFWAAPLITPDVLYITSLDHNVYALETETGREIWTTELPGAMAGSPVLSADGSQLYIGNFDYNLYALDAATGEQQWQVASENWIWGRPVLAGEKLFFGDLGGNLYAVEPATGSVLWQQQVADAIRAEPLYDAETGRLYVASRKVANPGNITTRGAVMALDTESYRILWEQPTDEAIYTGPALANGLVLVAPLQGEALLLAYNAETGVLQWRFAPVPAK